MSVSTNSSRTHRLLVALGSGDKPRLFEELFVRHRERLRKMIRLRLDWNLRGKVSSTSVLEQVKQVALKRIDEYREDSSRTFYVWLRIIVGELLERLHRENSVLLEGIGGREIHFPRNALPEVTAASMAAQLFGDRGTNQSANRASMIALLESALNGMDRLDREIISLRNFEELTADESAVVLGMSKSSSTVLHLKALKKLNDILNSIPGFFQGKRGDESS
jgi:RNA polymerase sigma-70 factor, ECF subfamily